MSPTSVATEGGNAVIASYVNDIRTYERNLGKLAVLRKNNRSFLHEHSELAADVEKTIFDTRAALEQAKPALEEFSPGAQSGTTRPINWLMRAITFERKYEPMKWRLRSLNSEVEMRIERIEGLLNRYRVNALLGRTRQSKEEIASTVRFDGSYHLMEQLLETLSNESEDEKTGHSREVQEADEQATMLSY